MQGREGEGQGGEKLDQLGKEKVMKEEEAGQRPKAEAGNRPEYHNTGP